MKNREQIHEIIDEWINDDMTGNIIIYHAPRSDGYEAIIEQVVKTREMEPTTQAAFCMLMDDLGIERGEMFRNKDGEPDRIKLTRRFDVSG